MAGNRILLFGDSTDAPIPSIRQLLVKARTAENAQTFIRHAVDTVGQEVEKLTPSERRAIGPVHSIQDLQECFAGNRDHYGVARMVLLFVARIGELIMYVKSIQDMIRFIMFTQHAGK